MMILMSLLVSGSAEIYEYLDINIHFIKLEFFKALLDGFTFLFYGFRLTSVDLSYVSILYKRHQCDSSPPKPGKLPCMGY